MTLRRKHSSYRLIKFWLAWNHQCIVLAYCVSKLQWFFFKLLIQSKHKTALPLLIWTHRLRTKLATWRNPLFKSKSIIKFDTVCIPSTSRFHSRAKQFRRSKLHIQIFSVIITAIMNHLYALAVEWIDPPKHDTWALYLWIVCRREMHVGPTGSLQILIRFSSAVTSSASSSIWSLIRLIPAVVTRSARPEAEMTSPTGGARRPCHAIIVGVASCVARGDNDVILCWRHVRAITITATVISSSSSSSSRCSSSNSGSSGSDDCGRNGRRGHCSVSVSRQSGRVANTQRQQNQRLLHTSACTCSC